MLLILCLLNITLYLNRLITFCNFMSRTRTYSIITCVAFGLFSKRERKAAKTRTKRARTIGEAVVSAHSPRGFAIWALD